MNYKQAKRKFKEKRVKSSLYLLKLSSVVLYAIDRLNKLDDVVIKSIVILLGFQYDIYLKLYEVSYDMSYLENANRIKNQIEITLPIIGE